MKKSHVVLSVLVLVYICVLTGQSILAAALQDGTPIAATHNPFLYWAGVRPSSDPSAISVNINGENVVLLVASSDLNQIIPVDTGIFYNGSPLSNYYPMDKTYLYAMNGNYGYGPGVWYDFGAISQESDFSWSAGKDYQWAPDIEYVPGSPNKYYLFVPDYDGNKMRIGVKHRDNDPFGSFNTDGSINITNSPPNNGFASDPGVFTPDNGANYYMTYCQDFHPGGRIQLARITNANFTQAEYLGQIVPAGMPGGSNLYAEGPDIVTVPNNYNSNKLLYLMFAAKADDNQEYIGYATTTPDYFQSNPITCWSFGGWIMKDIDPSPESGGGSEWTNQASLVVLPIENRPGKYRYFLFYHYSQGDLLDPKSLTGDSNMQKGQMRQIAMKEVFISSDGKIVGVTNNTATDMSLGHEDFTASNDCTYSAITADLGDSSTAKIAFVLNNPTYSAINNPVVRYYFTKENGGTPVLDASQSGASTSSVVQINGNLYAVELHYNITIGAFGTYPSMSMNGGFQSFTLKYSQGNIPFDKSNDFSQPLGKAFTNTDRVAIYNSDLTTKLLGRFVSISPSTHNLTCTWKGMALTCTTSQTEIRGQEFHSDWASQNWIFEPVLGTNFVRFKNPWSGKYLAATSLSDSATVQSCDLNPADDMQKWEFEPVEPTVDMLSVRIKNIGSGRYLTMADNENTGDPINYCPIYTQTISLDWGSQRWIIDNPRVYLVSQYSGKLLTVTSSNNDAEVRAQDDHSGWGNNGADHWSSQEWLREPIPGSRYVRFRNMSSNRYLMARSEADGAVVSCHDFDASWGSQQWEPDIRISTMYRNRWTGRTLTVTDTTNWAPVTSQTSPANGNATSQQIYMKY